MDKIKKLFCSPYLWWFLVIMLGAWLFCWSAWGGEITTSSVPYNEAGLGLNPPMR